MPSRFTLKTMNAVHRGVLAFTRNRIGWSALDMPVLELTTIGRTSGRPRKVMLTSPYQQGSTLVVVASRGGDDRHPAWFLNLRDNPQVQVRVRGSETPMQARIATGDERRALWARVVADHPLYGWYQARTSREIPLVLLEPGGQTRP